MSLLVVYLVVVFVKKCLKFFKDRYKYKYLKLKKIEKDFSKEELKIDLELKFNDELKII